jgi:hypothetical protein
VKWTVTGEMNVVRYEVELAKGNAAIASNNFVKIGEVTSLGNTATNRQYNFNDAEPGKQGARYYRLKIINADGSFSYSEVRAVFFGEAVLWQVYPNPSDGKYNLVYQLNTNEVLQARLYDTKGSLVKEYRSEGTGFLQKLNVDISANNYASGVYLLSVRAGSKVQSFRLYKQ